MFGLQPNEAENLFNGLMDRNKGGVHIKELLNVLQTRGIHLPIKNLKPDSVYKSRNSSNIAQVCKFFKQEFTREGGTYREAFDAISAADRNSENIQYQCVSSEFLAELLSGRMSH